MSESDVEAFLEHYATKHELSSAELTRRVRSIAAGRLATLTRYAAKQGASKKAVKGKKKAVKGKKKAATVQ